MALASRFTRGLDGRPTHRFFRATESGSRTTRGQISAPPIAAAHYTVGAYSAVGCGHDRRLSRAMTRDVAFGTAQTVFANHGQLSAQFADADLENVSLRLGGEHR